eukprot:sb/3462146/
MMLFDSDYENPPVKQRTDTQKPSKAIVDLVKNLNCTQAEKDAFLIAMEKELARRDLQMTQSTQRRLLTVACRQPSPYDHVTMDIEHFLIVFSRYVTNLRLDDCEKITAFLTFLSPNTLKKVLQTAPELAEECDLRWTQYRERIVQVIESLNREQALTARISLKSRVQKTGETFCEFAEALTTIAEQGWSRAEELPLREIVLKQAVLSGAKNYWVRVWLIQNQEKYPFRELVAEANAVEVSHSVQESDKRETVEVSVLRAQKSPPIMFKPVPSIHYRSALVGNLPQVPQWNNQSFVPDQHWIPPPSKSMPWCLPRPGEWLGKQHPQLTTSSHEEGGCYNCLDPGHFARDCPRPKQRQNWYRNRNGYPEHYQHYTGDSMQVEPNSLIQEQLGYGRYNGDYYPESLMCNVNTARTNISSNSGFISLPSTVPNPACNEGDDLKQGIFPWCGQQNPGNNEVGLIENLRQEEQLLERNRMRAELSQVQQQTELKSTPHHVTTMHSEPEPELSSNGDLPFDPSLSEKTGVNACLGCMHIKVGVSSHTAKALIDCGSCVSLVSRQVAEKAGLMDSVVDKPVDIIGVSGYKFPTFGVLRSFPLEVQGKNLLTDLLVADIAEECILGQDFLENHQFTLDFGARTMQNQAQSLMLETTAVSRVSPTRVKAVPEKMPVGSSNVMTCLVVEPQNVTEHVHLLEKENFSEKEETLVMTLETLNEEEEIPVCVVAKDPVPEKVCSKNSVREVQTSIDVTIDLTGPINGTYNWTLTCKVTRVEQTVSQSGTIEKIKAPSCTDTQMNPAASVGYSAPRISIPALPIVTTTVGNL